MNHVSMESRFVHHEANAIYYAFIMTVIQDQVLMTDVHGTWVAKVRQHEFRREDIAGIVEAIMESKMYVWSRLDARNIAESALQTWKEMTTLV